MCCLSTEINNEFKRALPWKLDKGLLNSFTLSCSPPSADPPNVNITWLFNGVPLATGLRHNFTNSNDIYSLSVTDVLLSDTGNYSCRAENIAGVRLSTTVVTILGMLFISA